MQSVITVIETFLANFRQNFFHSKAYCRSCSSSSIRAISIAMRFYNTGLNSKKYFICLQMQVLAPRPLVAARFEIVRDLAPFAAGIVLVLS